MSAVRELPPVPAHSMEAEQSLLGGLLLDGGSAWERIAGVCEEADLYRDDHRRIFRHIAKLIAEGKAVDVVTVAESLQGSRESEQAGGLAYLGEMANSVASTANIRRYAEIIRTKAAQRRIQAIGAELSAACGAAGAAQVADLASRAQEAIGQAVAVLGGDEAKAWPPIPCDVGEYLRAAPPPVHWFAHERLLADRGHVLTGIGGSSKTRALIHLAIGAVTGRIPWGWQIELTGKAVLFLCEDTQASVHRTLSNIIEQSDFTRGEINAIAERLKIFPLAGQDTRLLALGPGGALNETAQARGLFRTCQSIPGLRFIGMDPALALTEGDELNQAHQRRLGAMVDRLALESGACVVMTSHAAKSLQGADEVGSHASRGGGALTDAVRAEYALRTMTAQEARRYGITELDERKAHVQLVATKGNELPPAAYLPVWLRRGPGGVLQPAHLSDCESAGGGPIIGTRERAALNLLRAMSVDQAVKLADWREACIARIVFPSPTPDAAIKAMQRIVKALLDAGLVEAGTARGVYLPTSEATE